jgi:hypothetical protein
VSGTSYCTPHTSQMARSPDSNFMLVLLNCGVAAGLEMRGGLGGCFL